MTRNAPADLPREIPTLAACSLARQNWPAFAHMGAISVTAPPSGMKCQVASGGACGVVAGSLSCGIHRLGGGTARTGAALQLRRIGYDADYTL